MATNDIRHIAADDLEVQDLSAAAALPGAPADCRDPAPEPMAAQDDEMAYDDVDAADDAEYDDDTAMEVEDFADGADAVDLEEAEISIGDRSSFLDEVRMSLCDEANASGARQTVLMCHASGRVALDKRVVVLSPNLMQRMPDILRDFQLVRDTLSAAAPEDLENWIEMPSGHVMIGSLVTCWKSEGDSDPYFMLRRFYRGVSENAPYVATWRGSGMTSGLPLAEVVSLNHVAIGTRPPMPMAQKSKLTALKLVALTWGALAYRLEPTIIAGRAPFVVPETIAAAEPEMALSF